MKTYRVRVNGRNYLLDYQGTPTRMGFYTTRFVRAEGPDRAAAAAVSMVREEWKHRQAVLNAPEDPPSLRADEVSEVDGERKASGFTFYPDEGPTEEGQRPPGRGDAPVDATGHESEDDAAARRVRRFAVVLGCLVLFMPVVIILALRSETLLQGPVDETFQSEIGAAELRIERRRERWVPLPGAYYVVLSRRDGDADWTEVMTFRHDDAVPIPRHQLVVVDERVSYVYLGWKYAVTVDGGRSWSVWDAEEDLPSWECCNHGLIAGVELDASGAGRMALRPIPGRRGEVAELVTTDHGRHWTVPGATSQSPVAIGPTPGV